MELRELITGSSFPKICVPLTSKNYAGLEFEIVNAYNSGADLVEFRADFFEDIDDIFATFTLISELNEILNEMPMIFTFRTKNEGGNKIFSKEEYIFLLENVIKSRLISAIDLEMFTLGENCKYLIDLANQYKVYTILSSHDFKKTPSQEEIENILSKMVELGCDIPKIAVTPYDRFDVLSLMAGVINFKEKHNSPVIAISMKELGNITRVCCEFLGTCLTFATVENSSAPGQMDISTVYNIIHALKYEQ